MMSHPATQLPPGFRFHPTDEELIVHYLMNRTATPSPFQASIIAEVDIYKFDPWDLPEKAMFGDREWYFFTPRDRKYPNGLRPNRAAVSGYWKATGSDKPISSGRQNVGVKKALVFYKGKPLKGAKTNWIMHEYRLPESQNSKSYRTMRLDDWVLCRIYKKSCHLSPLLIDQQQEDSCADNAYFHTQSLAQEHSILKFPKTSYISEIFEDYSQISNVFGNQQELTRFDRNTLIDQPISWLQQTNQSNDSTVLMRQKHDERNSSEQSGESLHSSEKQNESNIFQSFSAQFDNSQYSLLINSQLDLQ